MSIVNKVRDTGKVGFTKQNKLINITNRQENDGVPKTKSSELFLCPLNRLEGVSREKYSTGDNDC